MRATDTGFLPLKLSIPPFAAEIIHTLDAAGFEAVLVGGCVRDLLSGARPHDADIATSALPQQTAALFARTVPTGEKYGTVTVFCGEGSAEVTTFRTEAGYADHRRPTEVRFSGNLQEDLKRRDFTINAMAYHPDRGLFDPFGGRADLAAGRIRAVGNSCARFQEDALRILRAFRFAARLGFTIEPATLAAAHENAALLETISAERIRAELERILLSARPEITYDMLRLDVLRFRFGAPSATRRRFALLSRASASPAVRWAAFFYLQFPDDAAAPDAMRALKFDNRTRRDVLLLLGELHVRPPRGRAAVKRLLQLCGPALLEEAFLLRLILRPAGAEPALQTLREVLAAGEPYRIDMLAVGGSDLIAAGIAPGPACGAVLERLLDAVLRDPSRNERETLLRMVRHMRTEQGEAKKQEIVL